MEAKVRAYEQQYRRELEPLISQGRMSEMEAKECVCLFRRHYEDALESKAAIDWSAVAPIPVEDIIEIKDGLRVGDRKEVKALLDKLVVLKLNGGVGTSMGCSYPKSCITVKGDETFLHVVLRQIDCLNKEYGVRVPLVLMNSDRTDEMTRGVLQRAQKGLDVDVFCFKQPVYPRADAATLLPTTAVTVDNPEFWYPPGHASVLTSFKECGLADKFAAEGKEWVFISNSDNLGALPDPYIFSQVMYNAYNKDKTLRYSFFMEATPKTALDVKGGSPVLYQGKPYLLEVAQVPKGKMDEFCDTTKFRFFNTANLWIHLGTWMQRETFNLPIICNPKQIQGDRGKADVMQLEMGVGMALSEFDSAILNVPRNRFIPVKMTCDLLRLQSDLYDFKDDGSVVPIHETLPVVTLSDEFKAVADYERRVKGSLSLKDAKSVKLVGNVVLEDVSFVGTVDVEHRGDTPLVLSGTYNNKVIHDE